MLEFFYAYILGTLSLLSPCTFILLPVITSEIGNKIKRILFFMGGIVVTFSILGFLTAITGKLLTNFMGPYLYLLAGFVTTLAGLDMLGIITWKIPSLFKTQKKTTNPFFMGLIYGGVVLSCVGPLMASILAYITTTANIVSGVNMMLMFSLGFITPFTLFGLLITDKSITSKLTKHMLTIRCIGGIMLLFVSMYLFYYALRGML